MRFLNVKNLNKSSKMSLFIRNVINLNNTTKCQLPGKNEIKVKRKK